MKHTLSLAVIGFTLTTPVMADSNGANMLQDGVGNYSYIEQWNASNSGAGSNQVGNNNFIGTRNVPEGGIFWRYEQLGIVQLQVTNASTYIFQGGNDNGAWVVQHDGANQRVLIQQGGAFIDYEAGQFIDGGPSYGSYVIVRQQGFDDELRILQYGVSNFAHVFQVGDGGETNVARITQLGNSLGASVFQYGAGNRGVILQH